MYISHLIINVIAGLIAKSNLIRNKSSHANHRIIEPNSNDDDGVMIDSFEVFFFLLCTFLHLDGQFENSVQFNDHHDQENVHPVMITFEASVSCHTHTHTYCYMMHDSVNVGYSECQLVLRNIYGPFPIQWPNVDDARCYSSFTK